MKHIIFFLLLFISKANYAQFYDSSFYSKRIKSVQEQVLRQTERNLDFFYEEMQRSASASNYIERFLFFKLDSTGRKIEKWVFTDKKGNIDSKGLSQYNISNIVVYWNDMFKGKIEYNKFTFIQPVLFRAEGLSVRQIESIPCVYLDSAQFFFDPVIRLPQINSQVYKPRH